jgi:glycosyltransferase involved in cell wall biosynthesis
MRNNTFRPASKVKYLYYKVLASIGYLTEIVLPPKETDPKKIPIIINNFNRLSTLKQLIESLENRGYYNIYIIDNKSDYPPLLEYYKTCPYKVFMLDRNIGTLALWHSGIVRQFNDNFFVYTDSDVVPVDECPEDFMKFFLNVLRKHRLARKVGFSLKIDDIPECNLLKESILKYESPFYDYFISEENLYRAPIGATFALYRPRGKYNHANNHIEIYRTGFPYQARHLPWYQDTKNPDKEELYYLERIGERTFYSKASKKKISEIGEKK